MEGAGTERDCRELHETTSPKSIQESNQESSGEPVACRVELVHRTNGTHGVQEMIRVALEEGWLRWRKALRNTHSLTIDQAFTSHAARVARSVFALAHPSRTESA